MSITINLSPETEKKLWKRAAQDGVAPDALAHNLLELALNGEGEAALGSRPSTALDQVLAPFRHEVDASGMTDDELKDFFTEVRDDVRSTKRNKPSQPSA